VGAIAKVFRQTRRSRRVRAKSIMRGFGALGQSDPAAAPSRLDKLSDGAAQARDG
jgi:hypothetical protein